ncbi:MAG: methyltransferase domain-containing protein [Gemmatimonadetes bacterium]|nr:methyltransferase domain-containing protein [Gemmatimonadota bacterium]
MDLERFYADHARIYDWTRFYLADRDRALAALDVRPGHRVIDFACGTGTNLRLLRDTGATLVGVDASAAMLDVATRKCPEAEFVRDDVRTVSLAPADRVLMTYALSMVPDWPAATANLVRHVKPGGVLVVLDFDRPRGFWAALGPLHRAWFDRFGVRTGLPVADAIRPHFDRVGISSRNGGWNFVVEGRGALGPGAGGGS